MFAPRYFAPRYFAPRYWPPALAQAQVVSLRGGGRRRGRVPLYVFTPPLDPDEEDAVLAILLAMES